FGAGYRDGQGAEHVRRLALDERTLMVTDQVRGFAEKAVLRWRLEPGHWVMEGSSVRNGDHVLRIDTSVAPSRFELIEGWESRYYLQRTSVPVLEVEIHEPATITSQYRWGDAEYVASIG